LRWCLGPTWWLVFLVLIIRMWPGGIRSRRSMSAASSRTCRT
jgi:hypothetical protein